jgi:transposase
LRKNGAEILIGPIRGYSPDHRSDCKQIVVALVVSRDGFPLAHRTFAGNMRHVKTVQTIVTEIETQFGKSQRIWVMDRGVISDSTLNFLSQSGRRYLLATRRGELAEFQTELERRGWKRLANNP